MCCWYMNFSGVSFLGSLIFLHKQIHSFPSCFLFFFFFLRVFKRGKFELCFSNYLKIGANNYFQERKRNPKFGDQKLFPPIFKIYS